MCGVAGIYAYRDHAPPVDRDELLRVRESMARRGPDGAGLWMAADRRIGLAHRRLAIIDLSAGGAQPMATADGRLTVTFNGEIYNYRELRKELEAKGFVFRTGSDTEVLLHLYLDRGARMVDALRGMFAFGLWDDREQQLLLARDPLGIKPLYYADDGATFRFASQVGALIAGGGVDAAEDVAGVAGFYLFGCVPDPYTCHQAIRALPAGATLRVRRSGAAAAESYFSIGDEFRKAEAAPARSGPGEVDERLRATLRDSMRNHMVADVPVGIFLSAGIDSTVLAALGAELDASRLHAITLGFAEYRGTPDDETIFAARTAGGLGIRHTERWIERSEFRGEWNALFAAMDQPSTDGVNSYLVSQSAARSGLKVAISGLGGDELFAGYPSFRDVPLLRRCVPRMPALGRAARHLASPLLRHVTSPKYAGVLEYGASYEGAYLLRRALHMPWELQRLMGRDRAARGLDALQPLAALRGSIDGLRNERCIVAALELCWYMRNQLLRDADWAGMHHGVEIRVPFVDATVIRELAPLLAGPNPPTKTQLARAIVYPHADAIAARRKTGFSVPVRDWLREDMPDLPRERGLRGWSRVVARVKCGQRFLAFLTDAYGGHGGIALYNRDLLQALCSYRGCAGVVAMPRHIPNPLEPMPPSLAYVTAAAGGKLHYLAAALRVLWGDRSFDLVVCGHVNLLPLAWLASRVLRVPLVLFIYGIDAWQPTGSPLVNALTKRTRRVVSISEVTARRFRSWSASPAQQVLVIPNAIHVEWYGPGARSRVLQERYGLRDRKVLMTLGRLVSAERYKGFDEIIDVLPALLRVVPDIAYLIVGAGSDRDRLEAKASAAGLADRVIFAGLIAEAEKADHYRLADAYVMPSRGEGFGFVLLEAMACGIPVIASKADGGREAVRDGLLGTLVDPESAQELQDAILAALRRPTGVVPPGLEHFSYPNFEVRTHAMLGHILSHPPPPITGP